MNMTATCTYDIYSFSDLHKDAYGRRPGNYYYEWLENSTDAERQAEWDFLCRTADQRELDRLQEEADALVRLEAQLAKTMADNRVDMATAIRWLDDAYSTNGDYQFLDYYLGVKYGTIEGMLGIKGRNLG
jgi:hypothetical protein